MAPRLGDGLCYSVCLQKINSTEFVDLHVVVLFEITNVSSLNHIPSL